MRHSTPRYLTLLPALYLSYDFLPLWYIGLNTLIICYISYFKTHKFFAYLNFFSVFFIFNEVGRRIIPETMVPIMCTFVLSQIIINKSKTKEENYLLFLWFGAFSLFSSGFYYLTYSITCFLLLLIVQGQDDLNFKRAMQGVLQNYKQFLITITLTVFLFVFFPRFNNFLPSANNLIQGKIGYSKEVNNSTTNSLQLSSQLAFYAELSERISQEKLYWRGRTLVATDGYNWRKAELAPQRVLKSRSTGAIKQFLKYEQDFNKDIILLNHVQNILQTNLNTYHIPINNEYRTYTKMKKSFVEAFSNLNTFPEIKLKNQNIKLLTQLPEFTPNALKEFMQDIPKDDPESIISKFKMKILRDKYSYSLSPGPMPTMASFLEKKIGFCTHFASLMGVVLRGHGIPTRLVNGFQGGKYNNIGNFYEIKSNDAHTWVEYHHNNKWHMVDPTGFIAPDRINLGGQEFLSPSLIPNAAENDTNFFKYLYRSKQYLDILNYRVSLLLDNYNKDEQKKLSKALKINLKAFFIAGIALIVFFLWAYYFLTGKTRKKNINKVDKILIKLGKKLKVNLSEVRTIAEIVTLTKVHESQELTNFIRLYQEIKYGKSENYTELLEIFNLIKVKNAKNI